MQRTELAPVPMPGTSDGVAEPVDAPALGRAVAPKTPKHRAIRDLYLIFEKIDASAALAARLDQLERLARWLGAPGKVPALAGASPADRPQVSRLRLLTAALAQYAGYRTRLAAVIRETLAETNGLHLLARLGLPGDHGLLGETADRISRRFIPEPRETQSWTALIARLFPARRDIVWLASVPDELLSECLLLLGSAGSPWSPLVEAASDAVALLAIRISAAGLSELIRQRSPVCPLRTSPFFVLPRACDEFIANIDVPPRCQVAAAACRALCEQCREIARVVVVNLEEKGVSVEVVYRLELLTKSLDRLERLVAQLECVSSADRYSRARGLLVELLQARRRDLSLADILQSNLHLLARKIIERAGHTGEHYITTTRREYFSMLGSAAGGGALTAGTTALKFMIGWAPVAPFIEGMLSAFNYAGSFLVMQLCGFTLATKQPSMTAATLAGSLRETPGRPDLSRLVETIARMTRSQFAAAVGNIGLVIPAALGLNLTHKALTGRPFLDEETALYVVASLHPTQSGTLFYAGLTGVVLWISSLGAGWLENWATYRRLPEAIEQHRVGRFVGRRTTTWAGRVFARNVSGFGGNATLGLLLGMTPVMGKFFGLPLDVRHVTLSTGALTLAVSSLTPAELATPSLVYAALGIAAIGILNFGVSFVLALAVALRARSVDFSDRLRLLSAVLATFLRSPLQFFLPPKTTTAAPSGGSPTL